MHNQQTTSRAIFELTWRRMTTHHLLFGSQPRLYHLFVSGVNSPAGSGSGNEHGLVSWVNAGKGHSLV